jgi:hypothetical protein
MYLEFLKKTEPTFPEAASPEEVTAIKVWLCKYKSLANIKACRHLKTLVINGLPEEDPSWIGELTQLEYLWIQNPSKVKSLDFISQLKKLRTLSLSTPPSWDASKKFIEIQSLEPISSLENLNNLELFGVCAPSRSLEALKKCRALARARFNGYPQTVTDDFYNTTNVINEFAPEPILV